MSDEIRTAADLRASIVDQRGGIERFDGPQRRLLDALVFELAKKPNEIDVRVVTDLMAMLPRPVSAPEQHTRDDHDAAVAPLLKLFRYLHESVHTLSAENAQLRAALGGSTTAITPPTCDIVPPGERAECDAGARPGPDDKPRRPGPVIEAVPNPPAAPAYDYNREQGWKDYVLPDGNISPTPFGGSRKFWGPV
jgi:hypothetical protein